MDKGIRAYTRNYFVEQNELRRRGEAFTGPKGNAAFRKHILYHLIEQFGCSMAASATHYNDALQFIKGLNAELVSNLGRPPEKNNGGRKRKQAPASDATPAVEGMAPEAQAEACSAPAAGGLAEGPCALLGWDPEGKNSSND